MSKYRFPSNLLNSLTRTYASHGVSTSTYPYLQPANRLTIEPRNQTKHHIYIHRGFREPHLLTRTRQLHRRELLLIITFKCRRKGRDQGVAVGSEGFNVYFDSSISNLIVRMKSSQLSRPNDLSRGKGCGRAGDIANAGFRLKKQK